MTADLPRPAARAQTAREAALEAAKNWALMYPIPAWGLTEGAGAEKLAANWAEVIVRDVIDPAIAAARREAANELWAEAERLRAGFRTGDYDIAYINGWEDASARLETKEPVDG